MNGASYYTAFPYAQSEALPAPGAALGGGAGGEGVLPALSAPGGGGVAASPAAVPPPGSIGFSQELYSYALGETESAITRNNTPGTNNSGWRAFALIATRNFIASKLAVAIRNTGGLHVRLGLFDANGHLLQKTPRFTPVANSVLIPVMDSPLPVLGGQIYYLGIWTDDTTGNLQFSCLSGRSVSTRTPLMQRSDPNENATTLSSAFPNTPLRPWLMVAE